MMTRRLAGAFLVLVFVVIPVSAQTPQATPPNEPPKPTEKETSKPAQKTKYDALLEKVQQKDSSVNFTELRHAFYESPNYHPQSPMMSYRPMNAALAQKNYEEALKIAESVLAKNFVEINAHMTAQIAYQETGNAEKAEFHKFMVDGLLNSIKSSRDGTSKEKAFEVISINEEYGLIRSLGLRPIKQALQEDKGHFYDVITVVDPQTNQQSQLYFNIDKPFKWKKP